MSRDPVLPTVLAWLLRRRWKCWACGVKHTALHPMCQFEKIPKELTE